MVKIPREMGALCRRIVLDHAIHFQEGILLRLALSRTLRQDGIDTTNQGQTPRLAFVGCIVSPVDQPIPAFVKPLQCLKVLLWFCLMRWALFGGHRDLGWV